MTGTGWREGRERGGAKTEGGVSGLAAADGPHGRGPRDRTSARTRTTGLDIGTDADHGTGHRHGHGPRDRTSARTQTTGPDIGVTTTGCPKQPEPAAGLSAHCTLPTDATENQRTLYRLTTSPAMTCRRLLPVPVMWLGPRDRESPQSPAGTPADSRRYRPGLQASRAAAARGGGRTCAAGRHRVLVSGVCGT